MASNDYYTPIPYTLTSGSNSYTIGYSAGYRHITEDYVEHTIYKDDLLINFSNQAFSIPLKDLKKIFNDVMVKLVL